MVQEYTLDEVKSHNSAKDLWMVIHGDVYDLTKFLHEVNNARVSYIAKSCA